MAFESLQVWQVTLVSCFYKRIPGSSVRTSSRFMFENNNEQAVRYACFFLVTVIHVCFEVLGLVAYVGMRINSKSKGMSHQFSPLEGNWKQHKTGC